MSTTLANLVRTQGEQSDKRVGGWSGIRVSRASYCRVDAAGVPAEWVETAVASYGQRTIVYFLSSGSSEDALDEHRPTAAALAAATGARVLSVACASQHNLLHSGAVERGCAAYAWLLAEGCDVELTAFTQDLGDAALVEAILDAAGKRCLPVPADVALRGLWTPALAML